MEQTYCTYCNTLIEWRKVEGAVTPMCPKCSRIEGGYMKKERELVSELQDYFHDEEFRIGVVLMIFRKYRGIL
jgi:phage FluMu protein Com